MSKTGLCMLMVITFATIAGVQAAPAPAGNDTVAFTVLSLKDGLPNSSVSSIVQDSRGFLWMGTQGGLVRYDGTGFTTWENEPFNEKSISGDLIQTMFLDDDDTLWIGTYAGLNRFEADSDKIGRASCRERV